MSHYHNILGLKEGASKKEIKTAYRILAKKYHPDINNSDDAEAMFIKITEAYSVLYDNKTTKRKSYKKTSSQEDLINAARERAKAYAQMRYKEFVKKNQAFESTPMHKIFWPKWVNFLFILFSLIFICDDLLPLKTQEGIVKIHSSRKYSACNVSFIAASVHQKYDISDRPIKIKTSPIMGFVVSYSLLDDPYHDYVKPSFRETDYIAALYVLLILAIITLFNKTKKIENKLFIKALMVIFTLCYLFIISNRFF